MALLWGCFLLASLIGAEDAAKLPNQAALQPQPIHANTIDAKNPPLVAPTVQIPEVVSLQSNSTNSSNSTRRPAPSPRPAPTPTPSMKVLAKTHISGSDSPAGSLRIEVHENSGFEVKGFVRINAGGDTEEDNQISGFGSLIMATPTKYTHGVGEQIWMINAEDSNYAKPSDEASQQPVSSGMLSNLTAHQVLSFIAAVFGMWFLAAYIINLFEGKKGVAALPFAGCCMPQNRYDPIP